MHRQKDQNEKAECTFKPQTLTTPQFDRPAPTHGDRNLDLHSKVRMGAFTVKRDKDSEEHDYERNAVHCIHAPTINEKILPHEISLN